MLHQNVNTLQITCQQYSMSNMCNRCRSVISWNQKRREDDYFGTCVDADNNTATNNSTSITNSTQINNSTSLGILGIGG